MNKNSFLNNRRTATGILLLSALGLALTSCSTGQAQAAIKPTWITPQVSGKTVTIPVSDVQNDSIVHFKITDANGGSTTFMAYILGGTTYARADVCPPCRSTSFSLVGNTLVCDTCGTVFDAKTGDGLSGGCVSYPKADVAFQVSNGNLVMNADQMATAYQNTLTPGRP
jgi:nitrite reductase/ring-hydroxylating ferredoxin subunit